MKSICIVTDGYTSLEIFLKENLRMVLGESVELNTYYLKNLKAGDIINDDLILVMIDDRALEVKQYVPDSKNIIVINRTIMESEIYKLFLIPDDTNVFVVNDNRETTFETIALLYRIGINHLNLVPFLACESNLDIDIAITPGESSKVPSGIKEVIDLGHRYIDISTFLTIINRLNIDNREISNNIISYSEKLISLDNGIKKQYKDLYTKNEDFDMIINLSKDGIILTNQDGEITVYNKSFRNMFSLKQDLHNYKVENIFQDELSYIVGKDNISNEVIKYEDKYLNVNKCQIKHFDIKKGYYYNIQEVTYIKKLEQNLSSKLRKTGQIAKYRFKDIKTTSENMMDCISLSKKFVDSDLPVLITGESGTGKEMIAQSIHNDSKRSNQPFIPVNCAAMPSELLESELFGYVGGSFTGALKEGKRGLFEQANNGSIFLDEIGDMPVQLQTKILRVLQEKEVMRIGDDKLIKVDVRVISATNRNLVGLIEEKMFRTDLYYRLNVLPIEIPPLRERVEDIIPLLLHFTNEEKTASEAVIEILNSHTWPGNIRELLNVSSYISLMCKTKVIESIDLPSYLTRQNKDAQSLVLDKEVFVASDINFIYEILRLIYEYNKAGKSIGRYRIVEILSEDNFNISESEVRAILSDLKDKKLITSGKGRGGSRISDLGLEYLNNKMN